MNDVRGHGTAVAGVAAAVNNTLDVVGVAPGVSLWSANVFDATGFSVLPSEVACALDVARLNGVFAVNMSFFLSASTTVTDAIVGAYDDGIYLVAAAGNNGQLSGFIPYPASLAEVVAVAALDSLNVRAYYSSYGSKIELSAPAEIATTTTLPNASACPSTGGGTIGLCNGTSIAAPHVAAAAAILKAYNPNWTNVFIRDRLNCAAQYLGDPIYYGNGLLRINSALDGVCEIDPN